MRSNAAYAIGLSLVALPSLLFGQMAITSFSPAEASYLGGTPFQIQGSGFPPNVTVRIDDVLAPLTSVSATTILGIAPAHAPTAAPVEVRVFQPFTGASVALPGAVTYIGPLAVTAVDPPVLVASAAIQQIIITGVGFNPSTSVSVSLGPGSSIPLSTVYLEPRRLLASVSPLSVGVYNVTASVTVAGSPVTATLPGGLVVLGPIGIASFQPGMVSELGATPFSLIGNSFTPNTTVIIGGLAVTATYMSPTNLLGTVPPNPGFRLGEPVPVTVLDPLTGTDTLPDAFEFTGPFAISSISPNFIVAGTALPAAIYGVGFTATTQVEIGGIPVTSTFDDHTRLFTTFPPLESGVHSVRVFVGPSDAPIAEGILPAAITVAVDIAPSIQAITPNLACADGGTHITIVGQNFIPETTVFIGAAPLADKLVGADGTTIAGTVPPLSPPASTGPVVVTVQDFRGAGVSDDLLSYTGPCATLRAPVEFESSIAYGTARFAWSNPEEYDTIEVLDGAGNLTAVLPGDATEYEFALASGVTEAFRQFRGIQAASASSARAEYAKVHPCGYPPPLGGAVQAGLLDLPIRGGHAAADIERCSDGDGPQGPFATIPYTQPPGTFGLVTPNWVLSEALSLGLTHLTPGSNTLRTGFTLAENADRLEFTGYYQKVAGDFGLALRGRLIHVYPDDGFTDEFTFPDPQIGAEKSQQRLTYYRATEDVGSPTAQVCTDGAGDPKPIPAGEYILEIYAVGGNSSTPYYVWGDDPRDNQIFIEGVPCPPYPLVQVRDMTGLRTLPNVSSIRVMSATENPNGTVAVTLSARGTWFDENNNQYSIDPYCDLAFVMQTSGGGSAFVCMDPPYQAASHIEFCWSIQVFEPALCKIDDAVCVTDLPDWGCFGIDLTVRDKACGIERTTFDEVPLIPPSTTCTPGSLYFSFLFPTPDPVGIHAIANLRDPSPGNGEFGTKRPLAVRVLVTPLCYCAGVMPCAGAFVFEDTPFTPPGAPPDLSDPGDDVQFRLVVRELTTGIVYHDLNAEVRVMDLCPDVADGPKYFLVYVDDLGEIPWSPYLNDRSPRTVRLQGRTNCVRSLNGPGTVCTPVADTWHNIGGPIKMMNHPDALDSAFWSGYYDEGDDTYRFAINSSANQEEPFPIPDSVAIEFGIVDAGIPAYEGNIVNTGFTSRIAYQPGGWFAEQGTGSSSGSLLENELATVPQVVEGNEFFFSGASLFSGAPLTQLAYEWCDHADIFEHRMSQELFRSLIYAGFIGPIPVNIWGSVGLSVAIMIDSYVEFRVAPFDAFPSGNFTEMQYTLVSEVDISLPCQIKTDILGGIASIALRLVPGGEFDLAPFIIAGLGSSSVFLADYYLSATIELVMEAEACIQTLIFGEQCLPTIEVTLIPETDIIPPHGSPPTLSTCGGSLSSPMSSGATAAPLGPGVTITSYEIANAPFSIVSPDGQTVVDAWVSANGSGRFLKVCVTEAGSAPIVFDGGIPGFAWYFLDPQAAFVDNDTVIFVGTGPPGSFTPTMPPTDIAVPGYLSVRNANVAHTEIQIGKLRRYPSGWDLQMSNPPIISDAILTPPSLRKADGRASIAADLANAEALVAWVRYTSDYLIQDGVVSLLLPSPGSCMTSLCPAPSTPKVRPQMEATSIVVRRVNIDGVVLGEPIVTISAPGPGINVQPAIALSPSSNVGYCVWVHDPIHTDLLTSNQGRQLKYAIYDASTSSWSTPMDVLSQPGLYPGMLEPSLVLKDDQNGMLAFTALPDWAAEDDSGLGGGSRFLYACRLVNSVFEDPVLLRGRCEPRQYGWEQSTFFDLEELVDPLNFLHMLLPDYFMVFQEFGPIGEPAGSGNVMVSLFSELTNEWTPAVSLLPEGSIMTNVTGSLFNGGLHSVHYDAGPATVFAGLVGPPPVGYQINDTPLRPDAAIKSCTLTQPFAGPGVVVTGVVEVENLGLVSTPFAGPTGASAIALEVVFVDDAGGEVVVAQHPVGVLVPGQTQSIDIIVEMPHDPVVMKVRVFPNPIDRDASNDERRCFFGAPTPEQLGCSIVETTSEDGASELGVRLAWKNPALYDKILVYRDGAMIHALPGASEMFTDTHASLGVHVYALRGVVGASKSRRATTSCLVEEPNPGVDFLRADTNRDALLNIADAIFLLNYLFVEGPLPPCLAAADTNFDGLVNIADAVYLLGYLFQSGAPPPPPFPSCGNSVEPTDVVLGCNTSGC
ncbi:MAG: IPT/TIG domain-containing protein [Planctomycetota bacterium]